MAFWSYVIPKQIYDKTKDVFKGRGPGGSSGSGGGALGSFYRGAKGIYEQKRDAATQLAASVNADKPGGTVQDITGAAKYYEYQSRGKLDDLRRNRGETGGSSGDDVISEPGSRQTAVRKGMLAKEGDPDSRRNLSQLKGRRGTLLTQGQKAKKLSRGGGR